MENSVATGDVSLYDEMDNAVKRKGERSGAFLDDSLEDEELGGTVSDACLTSCVTGESKRALLDIVEANAVLPDAFLDDSLHEGDSDANAKPACPAVSGKQVIFIIFIFWGEGKEKGMSVFC